eukprot:2907760-Pleurochrysis_carterae.AAC.1
MSLRKREALFPFCGCGISLARESSNTTWLLCGRACVLQQACTQRPKCHSNYIYSCCARIQMELRAF